MPTDNYDRIPKELQKLGQWVIWRYEDIGSSKPTKVPYDAKSLQLASVNDKTTWSTFDSCVTLVRSNSNFNGIGFVFSNSDPYAFIDLDDTKGDAAALDRQITIFKEFSSYAEQSPSGQGLHIIVKGTVPSGRRRSFIEIYSSQRYATFTGDVYGETTEIAEYTEKLYMLYEQMGSGTPATNVYKGDDAEKFDDQSIIKQATNAANGELFWLLYNGNWQTSYPSQSEADFALIDIISFYTQNKNQITRIFRQSALGQRTKASRKDYINWMINKSFDRMLPLIDIDGFRNALEAKIAAAKQKDSVAPQVMPTIGKGITVPPGLIGEIASYIHQSAPRPVPEIALAGAIGLMAGICGRAYNVSNTGLNQYVLCLASTGSGKDQINSSINKIIIAVKKRVDTVDDFIGPSDIASGQALLKYMNKSKNHCFVSIIGEFAYMMDRISSWKANSAEKKLNQMLLDLYMKSGFGQIFRPSIYSDTDKNIGITESPTFTLCGESAPEKFYSVLNETMISDGVLPRFLIIEYNGPRPKQNKLHASIYPSFQLIDKISSLAASCQTIMGMAPRQVINVPSTPDAQMMLDQFDEYCDDKINNSNADVIKQLWNRAHLKVLKLSALIAVGVSMADPLITVEYVAWSKQLIENDIRALSIKFEAGLIGDNSHELRQLEELRRVIRDYVTKPAAYGYMTNTRDEALHRDKIVTYAFISRRCLSIGVFRADRMGATNALKKAIQTMLDSDNLREIGKAELATKYGTSQRAFMISNLSLVE